MENGSKKPGNSKGIFNSDKTNSDDDLVKVRKWIPDDKEPIWIWQDGWYATRTLRFWDAKNNCIIPLDWNNK